MTDQSKLSPFNSNRSRGEKHVNRIIKLATTHPLITIGIVILITLAIIPGFSGIREDNNIRDYLGEDSESTIETNYIEDMFHMPKSTFLVTVKADDIYTTEVLDYIYLLHKQFSVDYKDIESITTFDGNQHLSKDHDLISIIENSPGEIVSITIDGITHNHTEAITSTMINKVNSIINAEDAKSDSKTLESFDFIEEVYDPLSESYIRIIPKTEEELARLKRLLENNKNLQGVYYSNMKNDKDNPLAWILTIEVKDEYFNDFNEVIDYVEETIDKTSHYGYPTKMFGVDYTRRSIKNESRNNVMIQLPLIALVIMIVFFLNFRTGIGVIIPELNTILSVIWVYGLIGYFGIKLSIIGYLILSVLFAVTSSYSIHSLNQFYKDYVPGNNHKSSDKKDGNQPDKESQTDHNSRSEKIANSMSHILTTIAIAGLTTFVSLVSLVGNNIIHLKTFGIFAGIGVIISVVLSITFIPAILVILPQKSVKKKFIGFTDFNNTFMDKLISKTTTFTIKYKYVVLIVFIVLVLASISGVFFIKTDTSFVLMFNPDHKVRHLSKHFSEHTGGVSNMMVTIDAAPELNSSIRNNIDRQIPDEEPIKSDTHDKQTQKDPFSTDSSPPSVDDPFSTDSSPPSVDDPFSDDRSTPVDDPFSDYGDSSQDTSTDYIELFGEEEESTESGSNTNDEKFNHILNSELLQQVEELSDYIKTLENVGSVYSYSDTIKHLHYIYNGSTSKEEFERIPDDDKQIETYKNLLQGKDKNEDGIVDRIESLVEPTYNKLNIVITLIDKGDIPIDTGDYKRIEERISEHIDENFKDFNMDYYITGWSVIHKDVQDEIVNGQFVSMIFSFFVIFVIISLLFRSVLSGLISIIPLSSSILVTMGIMGFTGIPLDMATALISAVAIGIAVDDTIHYMLHLRKFKRELGPDVDIERLVYKTTKFTSKAIIFTSIALIFGFLVVIFSSFVPVRQFAILTALTLFVATVATLWGLPSIFLVFPQLVGVKKRPPKEARA